MTKHKRALPARKPRGRSRDDDESLLLRSAESLGRVIGALQRQLDGATRRLSTTASGVWENIPPLPGQAAERRGTMRKRSATTKRAGAKKTSAGAASKTTRKAAGRKKTAQKH
jgi:hypothetical protein